MVRSRKFFISAWIPYLSQPRCSIPKWQSLMAHGLEPNCQISTELRHHRGRDFETEPHRSLHLPNRNLNIYQPIAKLRTHKTQSAAWWEMFHVHQAQVLTFNQAHGQKGEGPISSKCWLLMGCFRFGSGLRGKEHQPRLGRS